MVTGGPTAGAVGPGATPCVVTPATTPPPTNTDVSGGGATRRSASETRRSNKPIMEKRRRARINNCLNELKTLILDAMKKDPARHSKLEKADILEMTVKHLETLQRQQVAMAAAADPAVVNKFRAGFSECAGEVGRFPGLEAAVRRRLLAHLANCLNHATGSGSSTTPAAPAAAPQAAAAAQPSPPAPQAVQVHIVPAGDAASSSGVVFTASGVAAAAGLHLLPTRLPNGDIALVLPSSAHVVRQPPPAAPTTPELVPIPMRTASTASASSSASTSSSSSAASSTSVSPVAFERMGVSSPPVMCRDVATSPYHLQAPQPPPSYSPPLQKPLSLVVRKTAPEEDKPWRPW